LASRGAEANTWRSPAALLRGYAVPGRRWTDQPDEIAGLMRRYSARQCLLDALDLHEKALAQRHALLWRTPARVLPISSRPATNVKQFACQLQKA